MCSACWQRRPERPFVQAAHRAARLTDPPGWLDGFVAHLAAGNGPARACTMITELGRLLEDEHSDHPQNLLVHDIEAFPATVPKSCKRRLTVLRQFFRLART